MKQKKKKHPFLPMALMLCLIVVMLIAYQALTNQPSSSDSQEEDDGVTMIINRNATEITRLSYTYLDTCNTFDYDTATGVWSVHGDADFPLIQDGVSTMASAICQIGVYRTLDTGDTGEYGFDQPACEISVQYTDGESHHYQIGDRNATSGNYYFKDTDTGVVYMISSALLPYFQYSLSDFFSYESLPDDIDEAYVIAASVTAEDGTILASTTDADQIPLVYQAFCQLAPSRYAAWKDDVEIRTQYGIGASTLTLEYKRAVTVTDSSGTTNTTRINASYTVQFGEAMEDGSVPYMIGTSHIIYLADANTYSDLIASFSTSVSDTDA